MDQSPVIKTDETSPWSPGDNQPVVCGKCVRFGAGRSRVRISAGSYEDLVNWYCSLLTRSTMCRRATGNTIGLDRDGPRQVSLPKKCYSKWMKHQWKL